MALNVLKIENPFLDKSSQHCRSCSLHPYHCVWRHSFIIVNVKQTSLGAGCVLVKGSANYVAINFVAGFSSSPLMYFNVLLMHLI